jgi:hypothetical protein
MEKKDMLSEDVERLLNTFQFIEKYRHLSRKFDNKVEDLNQYVVNQNVFANKKFNFKNKSNNQYFTDFIKNDNIFFRLGFTIKFHSVEVDLTLKADNSQFKCMGSFGLLVQLMTNWQTTIPNPSFRNDEELISLVNVVIEFAEDLMNYINLNYPFKN